MIKVATFLKAFRNEGEMVHVRAFKPRGAADTPTNKAAKWAASIEDISSNRQLQDELIAKNQDCGLYFVVNPGGDTDAEIKRYVAFFAENDSLPIAEQHRRLDACPLQPSIRVEIFKSVHAYWLIEGDCSEAEWRDVQARVRRQVDGDPKIKNPSRLMRLPNFDHIHVNGNGPERKKVVIHTFEPDRRYTVEQMQQAFPQPRAANTVTPGPSGPFEYHEDRHNELCQRAMSRGVRNSKGNWDARGLCHGGKGDKGLVYFPESGAVSCNNEPKCDYWAILRAEGLPDGHLPSRDSKPSATFAQNRPTVSSLPRFQFTTLDDLLAEPVEERDFVVDRMLPRGGFSLVCAKPKVGKSTLARNLAVCVANGSPFFGRSCERGIVIYLCLEEKRAEVAQHFRRMGANGPNIVIHTGGTPRDVQTALEDAIERYSPALVIVDPLSRFIRVENYSDYGPVTAALEPLIDLARNSKCQCHIMALHHNSKGGDLRDGIDAMLGSTGFGGAVDTSVTMRKKEKVRTVETTNRYGEDMPETIAHLDLETGIVTAAGDMSDFTLNERKKAILDSIGSEPQSEAAIKEAVGGTNKGLTSKAVRALFDEGKLSRTGAGKKGDPFLYQTASVGRGPSAVVVKESEPLGYASWSSERRATWDAGAEKANRIA